MSQATEILDYIDRHGSITDNEARDVIGCHRLAARIADLKAIGIDIRTEMVSGIRRNGQPCRYARYWRG